MHNYYYIVQTPQHISRAGNYSNLEFLWTVVFFASIAAPTKPIKLFKMINRAYRNCHQIWIIDIRVLRAIADNLIEIAGFLSPEGGEGNLYLAAFELLIKSSLRDPYVPLLKSALNTRKHKNFELNKAALTKKWHGSQIEFGNLVHYKKPFATIPADGEKKWVT